MIVDMKKTTVLCLLEEKEKALEKLREIGVMHIDVDSSSIPLSDDRATLEKKLADAEKAAAILSSVKIPKEIKKSPPPSQGRPPETLIDDTLTIFERIAELQKRLDALRRDRELLEPWGDFQPDEIERLAKAGVAVVPCVLTKERFEEERAEIEKKGFQIHTARDTKSHVHFAAVAVGADDDDLAALPAAPLPEGSSLSEIDAEIKSVSAEIEEMERHLLETALEAKTLKQGLAEIAADLEFATNKDAMGEHGPVAHITGYVPEPKIETLRSTAEKEGWGLMITDIGPEDNPPTLIETPKIIEPAKPIFDFIGIVPGYEEWDISGAFLFFFTIFFGMIVGDAGYGFLFLLAGIALKLKFKDKENLKRPINLFIILSCATIAWGLLGGTVFAIPADKLPRWMRGVDWLTDPKLKNQHVQFICFLIAATHLSMARLWKAALYANKPKMALGQVGWAMILWGNFLTAVNLIVYPGQQWPITALAILYGGGALLVMACAVDWKDVGDVFNLPFGFIGAFVDLLSYIRLFAVGLSSYYIAASFNNMGLMLLGIPTDWLPGPLAAILYFILVVAMVLVIFSGHVLNIMLAFLGVLVHGIRLNTLEFSNHMELQWLGRVYKPFGKREE